MQVGIKHEHGKKYQSKNIGGIIMQNLTHEQELYVACLYGYSLQPEPWQRRYEWRDFVVDADFSCRLGVLVKAGTEYEPIVSKEQAQSIYEGMRESIESIGLDAFYEQNFGHMYHIEANR